MGADAEWTGEMHLLALLIEMVSIKVAGQQIKKPIDIPRPGKKKGTGAVERREQQQREQQEPAGALRPPTPPPSQQQTQTSPGMAKAVGIFKQTSKRR